MKKHLLVFVLVSAISIAGFGQRKILHLPDLPGYITLKCDFHIHTVFSDGDVWPTVRIDEALRDGLDAIAITDHLEYTPKKDFIPVDYNAAWKISETYAKERNLILVHGAEITRSMPPGHLNALFITDANALVRDSVIDAIGEAVKQGAFILWNHPGWKAQQPDGIPRMYDIHEKLLKNGWLNGIEFFNENEYYPLVLTWCRKYNLTVMGNSDVHGSISEIYGRLNYRDRPMTLVFAREKTAESLKEALFAGRTLVYCKDILAGKEEFARPFFNKCVSVHKPYFLNDKEVFLEITNNSDIAFHLVKGVEGTPESVTLQPDSVTRIVISKNAKLPLVYEVDNVLTGENEVLKVELKY